MNAVDELLRPAENGDQCYQGVDRKKGYTARHIADYRFEDSNDFCSFLSETPSGGRPRIDHVALTESSVGGGVITPKGLARLAKILPREGGAA